MKRLMDITQEMDYPFKRFLALICAQCFILEARRIVRDCADDAAFLGTIAFIIDVAGFRWGVERVDVVEGRRKGAAGLGAVRVCPCGYVGEVGS
jgi:hypothetical protein